MRMDSAKGKAKAKRQYAATNKEERGGGDTLIYTLRITLRDGSQVGVDFKDEAEALTQYRAIKEEDAERLRLQRVELFSHSDDHQIYIRRKADSTFTEPLHIRESDA